MGNVSQGTQKPTEKWHSNGKLKDTTTPIIPMVYLRMNGKDLPSNCQIPTAWLSEKLTIGGVKPDLPGKRDCRYRYLKLVYCAYWVGSICIYFLICLLGPVQFNGKFAICCRTSYNGNCPSQIHHVHTNSKQRLPQENGKLLVRSVELWIFIEPI